MRRQICLITLLLLGAALAGITAGLIASRELKPVSIPADAAPLPSRQNPTAQFDFSKWVHARQMIERPGSQTSPYHSDSTAMPASDRQPIAPEIIPTASDERAFYRMAETNPAAAVALAAQLDPSQRSNSLMENLIQRWATADLITAAAWVEQQTSGDEQGRLLQRIGFTLSQTDPAEAAEFVATQIPAGQNQDEAVMTIVNQWGNQDLAAAASWVKSFPEGPLQARAVDELEGIMNYQQTLAHQ